MKRKLKTGQGILDECSHNECDSVCSLPKHTKGPWIIEKQLLDIETTKGETLAKLYYSNDGCLVAPSISKKEALANARLIASAPELLEMLEDLHQLYKTLIPERERDESYDFKIENLIAKIKGVNWIDLK